MTRTSLVVSCVAAALLLGGCAPSVATEERVPSLAALSGAERDQLYAQQVAAARDMLLSAYPGATVPEADFVRYVLPSDWASALETCMAEAGFRATARPDGGIEFAPPPAGQEEALSAAYYVCLVEYPMDPSYARPLNDEQIRYLYRYFTAKLIPCLSNQGYEVRDTPSETTFIDQYAQSPWSPYNEIAIPSSDDKWLELQQNCPQYPATLFGASPPP